MRTKYFLNNPDRVWIDDQVFWLCIDNKFSMPYTNKNKLSWITVDEYMNKKYGDVYTTAKVNKGKVVLGLITNPLLESEEIYANETGNQTVADGDQTVGQETLFSNP